MGYDDSCTASTIASASLLTEKMEVPSYFKCPISLCLMKDPVSICTGITYDRSNIQKWLDEDRRTCPVTMQVLDSHDLIPNHTLRRIIQAWCSTNELCSIKQNPTPQTPLDSREARMMLRQIQCSSSSTARLENLKKLKEKVKESDKNRECLLQSGALPLLVEAFEIGSIDVIQEPEFCEEALGALAHIGSIDDHSRHVIVKNLKTVSWLLQRGNLQARIDAAILLESLSVDREIRLVIGATEGIFEGLVRLLKDDQHHHPAIKSSLKAFLAICSPMKNRVRVVEAGAVFHLIELLPDSEKALTELLLGVVECLCGCAEGRAAVAKHALSIPAIAKKLFKVSDMATEYAIDVLWAVCKYCAEEGIKKSMVEVGLFPKLFFFLQIGCNPRTKHKASDLLKLLHRVYKDCVEITA